MVRNPDRVTLRKLDEPTDTEGISDILLEDTLLDLIGCPELFFHHRLAIQDRGIINIRTVMTTDIDDRNPLNLLTGRTRL